jgi:hypothetical protein
MAGGRRRILAPAADRADLRLGPDRSSADAPRPLLAPDHARLVPWVLVLAPLGQSVGDNWESRRHNLGYLDYVVAAALLAAVAWWLRKRRGDSDSDAAPA